MYEAYDILPTVQDWLCPCSTLDPVLRFEQKGINPEGVGLIALALTYLTATPGTASHDCICQNAPFVICLNSTHHLCHIGCSGVLAGAIDYYIIAKIQNLRNDAFYVKVSSVVRLHLYLAFTLLYRPVRNQYNQTCGLASMQLVASDPTSGSKCLDQCLADKPSQLLTQISQQNTAASIINSC